MEHLMNKNISINKMVKIGKAKPFYRITLHSLDGDGDNNGNKWFPIQCPHISTIDPSKKYQFALEKFMNKWMTTYQPMYINIANVTQFNSYDSSTKSASTNIAMSIEESINNTINFDSIGIEISDINWLTNNRINITITDKTHNIISDMTDWSMSLLIWEVPDVDNK
jgi:hypothetical protein